jgi:hypothetical protein
MTRSKDLHLEYLQEREGQFAPVNSIASDFRVLAPSIATSKQIAGELIHAVRNGHIEPVDFAIKKKCIEDALELAFNELKPELVAEVEKYGKAGAEKFGATVTVKTTAKYDYSHDATWAAIKHKIAPLEAELKAQEEKIKTAVKTNSTLIDQDSGEVIATVVPCPRTETVAVTFTKPK